MCQIRVISPTNLTPVEWSAWSRIQQSRTDLHSAFFAPEFTRAVAAVRNDVEVAIISDGDRPVGFFPFQRGPRGVAQAVCGRLSEFHGVIAEPHAAWTPAQLIRECGLRSWHFDHLPVSQSEFRPSFWGESNSPCMDLSHGYEAYRSSMRATGASVTQVERKSRKLAREVGPLRFEFHTSNSDVFDSLIEWKTEQHRRTKVLQVLRVEWVGQLLDRIRNARTDGFRGVLSSLHAGDRLIAVHLGMSSKTALHIWFPAYNVDFERYSPGLILLLELAKSAAERGMRRIDFGRGGERYKSDFKNHDIRIAEGSIDHRWLAGAAHRRWFNAKSWIRRSAWREHFERPLVASRKLRQWIAFR